MILIYRFIVAVIWLCASTCLAWQGVVTHVSDGDTLWVQPFSRHKVVKVRILGIDAPEICQQWGEQSLRALQSVALGRDVHVFGSHTDTYGRLLGQLFLQGQDVGAWMVVHGHAWSYAFRSRRGFYDAEQMLAQSRQVGLFGLSNAMQPRFFRRRFGACP
ncbi:MAG: thermonuclease family protein [Burkholderiales bacterium]|nr:thermonuclease family protein [Burkholderiales bacterium]